MHLRPLPFVVFADFVPQLGLREALGGRFFLLLQLEQVFLALGDELARGIGMRS